MSLDKIVFESEIDRCSALIGRMPPEQQMAYAQEMVCVWQAYALRVLEKMVAPPMSRIPWRRFDDAVIEAGVRAVHAALLAAGWTEEDIKAHQSKQDLEMLGLRRTWEEVPE